MKGCRDALHLFAEFLGHVRGVRLVLAASPSSCACLLSLRFLEWIACHQAVLRCSRLLAQGPL